MLQLPERIADAIEGDRLQDVLPYLKAEIMAFDLETELAPDTQEVLAQTVGSE